MAEDKSANRTLSILSLLLIVGAIVFWIAWGVAYGGWNLFDKNYMGVYTIFATMFFIGLFGFLLLRAKAKVDAPQK